MKDSKLSIVTSAVPVVFEHYTEVPGLGDSVRHIDGFLALCDRFDALFLRRPFKNARSSIGDFNVSDAIGLSDILNDLSRAACSKVASGGVLECEIDFNASISGESDGMKGSMSVRDKSIDELYARLEESIVTSIYRAMYDDLGHTDVRINGLPYDAIRIRFAVRGTSLITRFSDGKSLAPYTTNAARELFGVQDDAVRIVMHLRRGDITVFPFREKFIASWGDFRRPDNRGALPEIIDSPDKSIYKNYCIDPYVDLVARVASGLKKPVKVTFISDGLARGVQRVRQYADHLRLSDKDLLEIEGYAQSMEADLVAKVAELKNNPCVTVESYIGEDGERFMESFGAIASADVLLYSSGSFSKTAFSFFNYRDGIALGPCTTSNIGSHLELVLNNLRQRCPSGVTST